MTGKGRITRVPNRRFRILAALHLLWLASLLALGAWWGILLGRQADRIAELERAAGLAYAADEQWSRTQRMLVWESLSFFAFVLAGAGAVLGLYWRDVRRARSLQAFFASVTHELRTPLTSIRLQAESIADTHSGPLVQRLLEDTLRLEAQVDRTLELARVEGGGPVFAQPIQLGPWLQRAMKPWLEAFGNRLEVAYCLEDRLPARADSAAVQIILKNLIENSIRHSGKDRVRVTVRSESAPEGGVAVTLRDDGLGFDGNASRLGTLFNRGPGSQGAGVGLYLVKVLMERMGGRAEFQAGQAGFQARLWFQEAKEHG